ncbi:glycerol dehydrogenase [Prauserella sp. PE36]|uniref:Glycerol dehydrogenase n=2 Tax=Prauserella TaxID=142577 RepID=A0A318LQP5_9PSEU|nr:glycerol dehydrogenase [Prauserella coralliicola]PXY35724.1 glycerol dehydrogenase [Prauserella flavalba]RBM22703.1 glycerol dehydrogenase [Prauserella sp. PE36]TKG72396.1 diol dehydratase small subunit [Prauserella endophytica]
MDLDPGRDYPLAARRPELLKTPTGKRIDELTMEAVLAGEVAPEDLRIAPETLRLQARIAEQSGRPQLAQNFRRAAELTALPDELVLSIYNSLRPRASTKQQLTDIADELESAYSATLCAALVREAADVYERRNILAS